MGSNLTGFIPGDTLHVFSWVDGPPGLCRQAEWFFDDPGR